jgi:hypothetical protein
MRASSWDNPEIRPTRGQMLYVTRDEALGLALSILSQVRAGNPNDGRAEFYMTDGSYFSVAVDDLRAREEGKSFVRAVRGTKG